MLKKIHSSELKVGMYVHDLGCDWLMHPFARNRFLLNTYEDIARIVDAGIHDVVIDSVRGLDLKDAMTVEEADARIEAELIAMAVEAGLPMRVGLPDELARAAKVQAEAHTLVGAVMRDARLGRAVELENVSAVVENIIASLLRNPGALLGLLRIRSIDDYTLQHSVSVCALLAAFCQARGLDAETTFQAGIGGLLHDTGKALVPDHILQKPGALTPAEFDIIRSHPRDGYDILKQSPGVGPIPLDITLHHHERRDGTGYPDKQSGDDISELARMAAIVDVYDAITSDRCYHTGIAAAVALRKIYEWSKFHFDPRYVQQFMRCVGIYPVGTMVLLESGRLGVVVEPHETNLLAPKVNVFFNTKRNAYIQPQTVDLSKGLGFGGADRILSSESPRKWQVDPARFMAIAT